MKPRKGARAGNGDCTANCKVNHGRDAESRDRQQEEHPEECTGREREEEEAWDGEVGVGEGGAGEGQAKQRGKEVSAGQRLLTLCWENTEVPGWI